MSSSISTPAQFTFPSLTVAEGRALLRAHIHGLAPSSDADDRRIAVGSAPPPQITHKVLNENVMRRTLHLIPATTPDTPDERIRHTLRRKSYPTYPIQFENDHGGEPLW
ncbi:hypothetical protein C8R44DRAFT_859579 [Mycena epipterygia]|nr:hypothetical protein C8R44DRAFT_859579 [Mycena epipterygia]